MKNKDRLIKATVVIEVEFYIDKDTVPEDVFDDMCLDSDQGHIYHNKVIHTAITKNKKIK